MIREPESSIICLSANGKTLSHSETAPRTLLIATAQGVEEFERDSATSPWRRRRRDILEGRHVSALLFEPKSNTLFASLHFEGGVLASRDGGQTWEERNSGLQSGHVYSLMVQYRGDKPVLWAGTEPVMLYRSDDLGASWQALPAVVNVPNTDQWLFPRSDPHIKNIASHPSEPDTIYVCVEQGDLLKSVDAGKSWRQLTAVDKPDDKFRRDIHRVVFRYDDPQEIFLTTGVGLSHTTDGGETWEQLTNSQFRLGYPDPLFIHPEKPNEIFMAGAGASPNPGWAAAGTAFPLFMRSTDNGRNWTEAMEGMRTPVKGNIEAVAFHYSKEAGAEFLAGTSCGELYHSADEAKSWALISEDIGAVSKGPHFRHFLSPEDREAYENKLRAMHAFA